MARVMVPCILVGISSSHPSIIKEFLPSVSTRGESRFLFRGQGRRPEDGSPLSMYFPSCLTFIDDWRSCICCRQRGEAPAGAVGG